MIRSLYLQNDTYEKIFAYLYQSAVFTGSDYQ